MKPLGIALLSVLVIALAPLWAQTEPLGVEAPEAPMQETPVQEPAAPAEPAAPLEPAIPEQAAVEPEGPSTLLSGTLSLNSDDPAKEASFEAADGKIYRLSGPLLETLKDLPDKDGASLEIAGHVSEEETDSPMLHMSAFKLEGSDQAIGNTEQWQSAEIQTLRGKVEIGAEGKAELVSDTGDRIRIIGAHDEAIQSLSSVEQGALEVTGQVIEDGENKLLSVTAFRSLSEEEGAAGRVEPGMGAAPAPEQGAVEEGAPEQEETEEMPVPEQEEEPAAGSGMAPESEQPQP